MSLLLLLRPATVVAPTPPAGGPRLGNGPNFLQLAPVIVTDDDEAILLLLAS